MSTLGVTLLIILVLAIIGGNILLLKKSTRFEVKKEIKDKIKKRNEDYDGDDDSW